VSELTTTFGDTRNPSEKFTFIKDRFTTLQSDLTNTNDRKTFEAVAITIEKAKLNAQASIVMCESYSTVPSEPI